MGRAKRSEELEDKPLLQILGLGSLFIVFAICLAIAEGARAVLHVFSHPRDFWRRISVRPKGQRRGKF